MLLNRHNYPNPVQIAAIGSGAVISQTILIRELLGLFRTTETTIGLLLSAWLLWSGIGGIASGRFSRLGRETNLRLLRSAMMAVGIALPLTILLIRAGRGVLASPPGALPAFTPAIIFALAVTAGPGLLFGSAYSAASLSLSSEAVGIRTGIGRVYIAEAAGAAAGAILFSILLYGRVTHLTASMILSAFMITASCLIPAGRRGIVQSVLLLSIIGLGLRYSGQLDLISKRYVFRGQEMIVTAPSRYGELVAACTEGSVSFYAGGSRLFSYPEPERAEETVDLPLLCHPRPRKVLLAGGSLGGVVETVLAHPSVDTLHCVEIDDALTSLFEDCQGSMEAKDKERLPTGGRLVERLFIDGRKYISTTTEKYDLVIVNPPAPINLQWNRYYTAEFFESGSKLLRGGGMLSISHPSSEEFIGEELGRVISCIKRTMDSVFDTVTVLPGNTAHFIAGRSGVDSDSILARINMRKLDSEYISEAYIPERLSRARMQKIEETLGRGYGERINRDSYPVLPSYELILESWKRDRRTSSVLERVLRLPGWIIPGVVVLTALAMLLGGRRGHGGITGVSLTGFSAFVIQMILIFRFQSDAGVVYHALIMLSALFMAGAAAGALWILGKADKSPPGRRSIHLGISAVVVLLLASTVLDTPVRGFLEGRMYVYYLFSLANGLLAGAYYHHSVLRLPGKTVERIPAAYYSADLLGACAGGLLAGTVVLPSSGIYWTAAMVLCVNIAAALLLRIPGR